MDDLIIQNKNENSEYPTVEFYSSTGECLIQGESYMSDHRIFYKQILNWLEKYTAKTNRFIDFKFDIDYYNTGSSKEFIEILGILRKFKEDGGSLKITWILNGEDLDLMEDVSELNSEAGIETEFIIR